MKQNNNIWVQSHWFVRLVMGLGGLVMGAAMLTAPAHARQEPAPQNPAAQTPAPAFGVVEVGASGVRSVGYRIAEGDLSALDNVAGVGADARYELLQRRRITDYTEADVTPLLEENSERTADAVRAFVDDLRLVHGVAQENIHVVIDSGLGQRDHAEPLAEIIHRRSGRKPEFITAADQAALAFEWVTPVGRLDQAVFVDIGSSNITIAYRDASGAIVGAEALPHGTKSFLNLVVDAYGGTPPTDLDSALQSVATSTLAPQLGQAALTHEGLAERPRVYLAGGASWALATVVRPQQAQEEWLRLAPSNFASFPRRAQGKTVYRPDLLWIEDPDIRESALGNIERLSNVFTRDQLLAASRLLTMVFDTLELHQRDAVFFARPARHGWQSQFLVEKARQAIGPLQQAQVTTLGAGQPVLAAP